MFFKICDNTTFFQCRKLNKVFVASDSTSPAGQVQVSQKDKRQVSLTELFHIIAQYSHGVVAQYSHPSCLRQVYNKASSGCLEERSAPNKPIYITFSCYRRSQQPQHIQTLFLPLLSTQRKCCHLEEVFVWYIQIASFASIITLTLWG